MSTDATARPINTVADTAAPTSLTRRLLALQPDEELIVPCAGRLEWKLVQNRVHGIAQYIRLTRDAAFRVRTWGCTNGVGVERAFND